MNKIIIIIFATLLVGSEVSSVSAQNQKKQKPEFDKEVFFERLKDFIIKDLDLTEKEIVSFGPLFLKFQRAKFEAGCLCREYNRKKRKDEKTLDEEYLRIVDECIESKIREAMVEKEYYAQFKKVLSPQKVYRLSYAENKFVKEFMRRGENSRR